MIVHLIKLCFLTIYLGSTADAVRTKIIHTYTGSVQGTKTWTVSQRMRFSSFQGIPYAEPPIGDLRFQPPVKKSHFGYKLTTFDNDVCAQYDVESQRVIGSEDCLYLNVYTPEIYFMYDTPLDRAVMVWIHGGAFMWGSKKESNFGPDFLIEKDVVVVSINYRLGAFGFLAVGKEISGNMGLKDQAMALQWVKDNIEFFGGDPNKITIFGESAGAVSVELHRLSPQSTGLFRASIAMSGSPLNPWAFAKRHDSNEMSKDFIKAWSDDWGNSPKEHMTFSAWNTFLDELVDVVREYDESDPNRNEIYQKLKDTSTEQIARTTQQLMNSQMTIPFLPTIEPSSLSHAFITQLPEDILKSRMCNAVPHILGYTHDEFIGIAPIFKSTFQKLYGLQSVVEAFASDKFFEEGIDKTRQYLNQYYPSSPVWQYINAFDYPQSLHKVAGLDEPGCGHADDIAHIFYVRNKNQRTDNTSPIGLHRNIMTTLWTNFAKFLNPTPHTERGWHTTGTRQCRLKLTDSNQLKLERLPGTTYEEAFEELIDEWL